MVAQRFSGVKIRPEIAALSPYRQGVVLKNALKLSSNENPYPPLPGVLEATQRALTVMNRYPDQRATALSESLARRFSLDREQIILGAGSVAILVQLVTAVAAAGDEVMYPWPSFEAYPWLPALTGATGVPVLNLPDHRHDLAGMTAALNERTRVIILCSPNNPTGTTITAAEFENFIRSVPSECLVVLDQAYAEFVTDPFAVVGETYLDRYPNLVVLHTFSKAYGLADLRIGYGYASPALVEEIYPAAVPLSVTYHSQQAALVSLDCQEQLQDRVSAIVGLRDRLWQQLQSDGWSVPWTQGNFLWLPTGKHTDKAVPFFLRNSLTVRPFSEQGIRVSIGETEAAEKILASCRQILQELPGGCAPKPDTVEADHYLRKSMR